MTLGSNLAKEPWAGGGHRSLGSVASESGSVGPTLPHPSCPPSAPWLQWAQHILAGVALSCVGPTFLSSHAAFHSVLCHSYFPCY